MKKKKLDKCLKKYARLLFNQNNDFFMTKYLNIQIKVNINTNGKNKCKCTVTNVKSCCYIHI